MGDSLSPAHLYPERRHRKSNSREETETSRYFEHSRRNEKHEIEEKRDDREGGKSGRQMLLSFGSNGNLRNKAPLINPISRSDSRRRDLREVAEETISLLPGLLATRPDVGRDGFLCKGNDVGPLNPKYSPRLPPSKVMVIDADTIDAALALQSNMQSTNPVCVLNMANAQHAGGGFKYGALAQEEALCYRSSLFFTLKMRYYPIPEEASIYSPKVMVFRESLKDGHDLMDLRVPATLPVIAVVSAAAVCQPALSNSAGRQTYRYDRDRKLMMVKMRTILRTVVRNRHQCVVLGAFGCGAFSNPPLDVAEMWKAVLQEHEFQTGWFEYVVFAVMDTAGSDNFKVFKQVLEGLQVG